MKDVVFPFTFFLEGITKDESVAPAAIFAHLRNKYIEKINFITPVYYPVYTLDFNGRKFIFDSNLLISSELNYYKNPSTEEFVKYIESKNDVISYIKILNNLKNFFKKFDRIEKNKINGLISGGYKEFFEGNVKRMVIKDIEGIIHKPKETYESAKKNVSQILDIENQYKVDIKELQKSEKKLFEISTFFENDIDENIKETEKKYNEKKIKVVDKHKEDLDIQEKKIKEIIKNKEERGRKYNLDIKQVDEKTQTYLEKYRIEKDKIEKIVNSILNAYTQDLNGLHRSKNILLKNTEEEIGKENRLTDNQLEIREHSIETIKKVIDDIKSDYTKKKRETENRVKEAISEYESERNEKIEIITQKYLPKEKKLEYKLNNVEIFEEFDNLAKRVGVAGEKEYPEYFDRKTVERQINDIKKKKEMKINEIRLEYQKLIENQENKITKIKNEERDNIYIENKKISDIEKKMENLKEKNKQIISSIRNKYKPDISNVDKKISETEKERDEKLAGDRGKLENLEKNKYKKLGDAKATKTLIKNNYDYDIEKLNKENSEIENYKNSINTKIEDEVSELFKQRDEELELFNKTKEKIVESKSYISNDVEKLISKKEKLSFNNLMFNYDSKIININKIFYIEFFAAYYEQMGKEILQIFQPSYYDKREKRFREKIFKNYFVFPFENNNLSGEYFSDIRKTLEIFNLRIIEDGKAKNILNNREIMINGFKILEKDGWLGEKRSETLQKVFI